MDNFHDANRRSKKSLDLLRKETIEMRAKIYPIEDIVNLPKWDEFNNQLLCIAQSGHYYVLPRFINNIKNVREYLGAKYLTIKYFAVLPLCGTKRNPAKRNQSDKEATNDFYGKELSTDV